MEGDGQWHIKDVESRSETKNEMFPGKNAKLLPDIAYHPNQLLIAVTALSKHPC